MMASSPNTVQSPLVPMMPDRTIWYEATHIPSVEGTLFTAQTCPPEVARAVILYASKSAERLPMLGRGNSGGGRVYALDNCALKIAPTVTGYGVPGLDSLKANVALHIGLSRTRLAKGPRHEFSAPAVYAALVPDNLDDTSRRTITAMELVTGTSPPTYESMPLTPASRSKIYAAAFRRCGINPDLIFTDDNHGNMKITSDAAEDITRVSKFDVTAFDPIDC